MACLDSKGGKMMDDFMNLIWTGDPVESVFRLCVVLAVLELFAVICSYLGGRK